MRNHVSWCERRQVLPDPYASIMSRIGGVGKNNIRRGLINSLSRVGLDVESLLTERPGSQYNVYVRPHVLCSHLATVQPDMFVRTVVPDVIYRFWSDMYTSDQGRILF